MTQAETEAVKPTAYLFDAGGLLDDEIAHLRRSSMNQWIYDHTGDARAETMGPVLVIPTPDVVTMALRIAEDAERAWAVNALCAQAGFDRLAKHIRALRQVRTQDGQRYYWRFADSRCLTALWKELSVRQQAAALGPISRWQFHARNGRPVDLHLPPNHVSQASAMGTASLRITDQQLSGLLDTVWPDQLLASVLEQHPRALGHLHPVDRHAHAQTVCDWLRLVGEERYPVQQAVMLEALSVAQANWDATQLHQFLNRFHPRA